MTRICGDCRKPKGCSLYARNQWALPITRKAVCTKCQSATNKKYTGGGNRTREEQTAPWRYSMGRYFL